VPPTATRLDRVLQLERTVWISLGRWLRRRPAVPPEATPFSYVGVVAPTLWIWIGVSAVEIPVLHLVIPWQAARIVLVLAGAWGLVWMVGYAASLHVYPHLVTPDEVHIRNRRSLDVGLPYPAVASAVPTVRATSSSRSVQLDTTAAGTDLVVPVSNQTNVRLALHAPVVVTTPRGGFGVSGVRLWVDDPAGFVEQVRAHCVP
jgi:hypothetical protein